MQNKKKRRFVYRTFTAIIALGIWSPLLAQSTPAESDAPEPVAGVGSGETIVVTARRRGTTNEIDKIVYDIATRSDGASVNTLDVIKQLPGVIVDPSRQIRFRGGASVGFLIDGKSVRREAALAIPASQIDRIELIANPPAQYQSDVDALINIILKQNAVYGWTGSASLKADTLGGYRVGANLNRGGEVWSVNASASVRSDPEVGDTTRDVRYSDLQNLQFNRQILTTNDDLTFKQISGQAKIVGRLSDQKTLSFVIGSNYNEYPQSSFGARRFLRQDETISLNYRQTVEFDAVYPYGSITFENKKDDGSYLTTSIEGFSGKSSEKREIFETTTRIFEDSVFFSVIDANIETRRPSGSNAFTVGASFQYNKVDDDLKRDGFLDAEQVASTSYRFDRQTYSMYGTFETNIGPLGIKPGLRLERFDQNAESENGEILIADGATLLLPSVHLSYSPDEQNSLKASFTVRIDKPDALYFNPFRIFRSSLQAQQGNPLLEESRRKQFEVSQHFQNKKLNVDNTFYYRTTNNDITSILFVDSGGVSVLSYGNLGRSNTYGYSGSVKAEVLPELSLSIDLDVYIKDLFIDGVAIFPNDVGTADDLSFVGVNASSNLNYRFNKTNTISANMTYAGATTNLNLINSDIWNSEISYLREFGKGWSLSVNLVNFFVPQQLVNRFVGSDFFGFERINRDSRLLRVGVAKEF